MGAGRWFDFTDASLRGDPRWAQASKWTGWAGPLVLTIAVLSIVQIVLGVIIIVSKNNQLSFGGVVQSLIIPGLSFFNSIPSAHLHILARSNMAKMAIWFSTPMSIIYFVSAIVYLAAGCIANHPPHNGLQKNDCPVESQRVTWDVMVALQLVSAVCYAVHAAMAVRVFTFHKKRNRAIEQGTLVEEIDLDAKARREQEARDKWQRIVDL